MRLSWFASFCLESGRGGCQPQTHYQGKNCYTVSVTGQSYFLGAGLEDSGVARRQKLYDLSNLNPKDSFMVVDAIFEINNPPNE